MIATNDEEYYENEELWGENSFVSLQNIIDNIILTADDDSYFKKAQEFRATIFGKRGLKELNVDLNSDDKIISFQLSPSLIFPHPRFMANWSRIGVITDCETIHILDINNTPIVEDYLQDNQWRLLYDDEGNVLQAHDRNIPYGDCAEHNPCECIKISPCEQSKGMFDDSWVRDVRSGSYFQFSPDLVDREITIEYQTAGLENMDSCDIKVPNNIESTLDYYIRWKLLEGKRNVPQSEVRYYMEMFKKEKRRSKGLMADKITLNQIIKSVSLKYK